MMLALSCDQLCPITADRALMLSALMISVAPINATCQCLSMPPASAHQCHINATYQCLPVHINATYQCPSDLSFSANYQCSASYQCCQSVLPISASQCCLSVSISASYQ
ncbi:unnamed protein product, partial [Staurois parvus]